MLEKRTTQEEIPSTTVILEHSATTTDSKQNENNMALENRREPKSVLNSYPKGADQSQVERSSLFQSSQVMVDPPHCFQWNW